MGDKNLFKSLNWDILRAISDDENDSDVTFIDEEELTQFIENISHSDKQNTVVDKLKKESSELKLNDLKSKNCRDFHFRLTDTEQISRHEDITKEDLKERNEGESYFGFSDVEEILEHVQMTKQELNKQKERESYFGFTDMEQVVVPLPTNKYEEVNKKSNIEDILEHAQIIKQELNKQNERESYFGFTDMEQVSLPTNKYIDLNNKSKKPCITEATLINENFSHKFSVAGINGNAISENSFSNKNINEQCLPITGEMTFSEKRSESKNYFSNVEDICIQPFTNVSKINLENNDSHLKKFFNSFPINENEKNCHQEMEMALASVKYGELFQISDKRTEADDNIMQTDDMLPEELTQNLLNTDENPFNIFLSNLAGDNIQEHAYCSPPLTLRTETRRRILPAEKKLPNYRKSRNSLPLTKKVLPFRKCLTTFSDQKNRIHIMEENSNSIVDASTTGGKIKTSEINDKNKISKIINNTKNLNESKPNRKFTTKVKVKCKRKHQKILQGNIKPSHGNLPNLLELEDLVKQIETKVIAWVSGSDPHPPSREQAFQMLTDTNLYSSQLLLLLKKKPGRRNIEKTKMISALLGRTTHLAVTIDNAIIEADRLVEKEQNEIVMDEDENQLEQGIIPVQSCDGTTSEKSSRLNPKSQPQDFYIKKRTISNNLKSILKNSSSDNSVEDVQCDAKHISFSDEVEYRFLSSSDQSTQLSNETCIDQIHENTQLDLSSGNKNPIKKLHECLKAMNETGKIDQSKNVDNQPQISIKIPKVQENIDTEYKTKLKYTSGPSVGNSDDKKLINSNKDNVSKQILTILENSNNNNNPCPNNTLSLSVNADNESILSASIFNMNIHCISKESNYNQRKDSNFNEKLINSESAEETDSKLQHTSKYSNIFGVIDKNVEVNSNDNKINKHGGNENVSAKVVNTQFLGNSDEIPPVFSEPVFNSNSDGQLAVNESSFGFSELESEDDTWCNVSIMNVKAIRVKHSSEYISVSNLSADIFESPDWFDGLDEWEDK